MKISEQSSNESISAHEAPQFINTNKYKNKNKNKNTDKSKKFCKILGIIKYILIFTTVILLLYFFFNIIEGDNQLMKIIKNISKENNSKNNSFQDEILKINNDIIQIIKQFDGMNSDINTRIFNS